MIIERLKGLPSLAWLVECGQRSRVVCGQDVEVGPSFVVEGCWDGSFLDANFAEAENFFGSGFTVLPDKTLLFVTATTTLDCIYVLARASRPIVSNSLPLLLAYADIRLDPRHNYVEPLATVVRGIGEYDKVIASGAEWKLLRVLHANFTLATGGIEELPKTSCQPFADRDSYVGYLTKSLSACLDNAGHPARRRRYAPLASCSSGYDSTFIAALAVPLGCQYAVSLSTSRSGESDSGGKIAQLLGLSCCERPRSDQATEPNSEIDFLATGVGGGGDYVLRVFEDRLKNTVFLTGYHGDAMWEKTVQPTTDFVRKDASGCDLTEFRLRVGFFNVSVAFIGGTRAGEIWRISNSCELRDYSVGGSYDRPICRSVLERAGVPREMFGMRKNAVTIGFVWALRFLHPMSRKAFYSFVREQRCVFVLLADRTVYWLLQKMARIDQRFFGGWLFTVQSRRAQWLNHHWERRRKGKSTYGNLLFLWALDSCVQERRQALAGLEIKAPPGRECVTQT